MFEWKWCPTVLMKNGEGQTFIGSWDLYLSRYVVHKNNIAKG